MLTFHTLDVFTDTPYRGNPLAVVLGADDLKPAQMQTMAAEFNLSETIFVQAPQNPAHTARVRIFFPTAEIPFAGHPTIGCAIHLATARHTGDFTTHLVLEEEAGLVPVTVTRLGQDIRAEFVAPVLPHATTPVPPADLISRALGLDAVAFGSHQPGVFQGGPRFLFVPVASLDDLARAAPQDPAWSQAMTLADVQMAYLYTPGTGCDYRARMFAPGTGTYEDPATGSASAILAAQLLASGALRPGTNHITLHQGVEMGRASTILLTAECDPTLTQIRIAGSAVPISQGQIRIPLATDLPAPRFT